MKTAWMPEMPVHVANWLLDPRIRGLTDAARGRLVDALARAWVTGELSADDRGSLPEVLEQLWQEYREVREKLHRKHRAQSAAGRATQEKRRKHPAQSAARATPRRANEAGASSADSLPVSLPDSSADSLATQLSTQHRTEQNRTEQNLFSDSLSFVGERARARASASSRKRAASRDGSRLPDDFELTERRIAMAEAAGVPPDEIRVVFVEFCNYWRSLPGTRAKKLDWDATWHNRCLRVGQEFRARSAKVTRLRPAQTAQPSVITEEIDEIFRSGSAG